MRGLSPGYCPFPPLGQKSRQSDLGFPRGWLQVFPAPSVTASAMPTRVEIGKPWDTCTLRTSSEKAMATHSSTLAWKVPWMEEPGRLQSMVSLRVGHNWAASLSHIGEGNGNPLQCLCLENPRDWGAWWASVYGVAQSRTRLKQLSSSSRAPLTWTVGSRFAQVPNSGLTVAQIRQTDFISGRMVWVRGQGG